VTALARVFTVAGVLLRATADAIDAFSRSVTWQLEPTPDYVPDAIDDGSAL
jgi:hypothetical protein